MSEQWSADDLMIVNAARQLCDDSVCFVGIGLPSTAANLARRTHATKCTLIYESGCIGSKPTRLPALDRRRRPRRHGRLRRVGARDLRLLAAGRAASTSASSARRSSTASATSTRRSSATTSTRRPACPAPAARPRSPRPRARSSSSCGRGRARSSSAATSARRSASATGRETGSGWGCAGGGRRSSSPTSASCGPTLRRASSCRPRSIRTSPSDQAIAATGWPLRLAETLEVTAPPTANELAVLAALARRVKPFTYDALAGRTVFAVGARRPCRRRARPLRCHARLPHRRHAGQAVR